MLSYAILRFFRYKIHSTYHNFSTQPCLHSLRHGSGAGGAARSARVLCTTLIGRSAICKTRTSPIHPPALCRPRPLSLSPSLPQPRPRPRARRRGFQNRHYNKALSLLQSRLANCIAAMFRKRELDTAQDFTNGDPHLDLMENALMKML